ncbi:hypothetical protein JJL56_11565 [Azospirillum sp. YIM DDC1]|uniref:DUF202 domain-containing protein n=1 Tax=Azospirillum aestuarii TaxID=2802052 RepID=A0ABS1HXF5_9PROT|nr:MULTISPECIES: hypothetical protein [Azospirillum]MBB3264543.1 hypothetical protein [Azospirillum sp. OGB3]MBK3775361.1 hypothetical protein [Azospirillum brasilense]MBK4719510.1 hypothetical protein [Azospirillum aestuarii]
MDALNPAAEARRQAGLEIQALAEDFEQSDEAAFLRMRIIGGVVAGVVTLVLLVLLTAGADWRYLFGFWVVIVGFIGIGYAVSVYRQRQQTARLRALATRWLTGGTVPPA